jgi:hypothetical protein
LLLTYCRTFPVGSVGCWWSRCSRVAPVVDGSSSSWCSSSDDVAYVAAIASIRISRGEKKELRALGGGLSCEADSLLHIGSGRVQRSHLCQSLSHSQLIHSAGLSIVPGASSSGAASAGSGADRWQAPAASSQLPLGGRRASRLCPLSCRSFAAGGFSPSSRFCLQPPARIRSDLSSALSSQTAIHSNSFFPRLDRSSLALCSRISFALMYFIHRILLLVVAVASLARGADEGVSGSADGDSGSSRGIPIVLTPWKVRFACL